PNPGASTSRGARWLRSSCPSAVHDPYPAASPSLALRARPSPLDNLSELLQLLLAVHSQEHLLGEQRCQPAIAVADGPGVDAESAGGGAGLQIEEQPVTRIHVAAKPHHVIDARSTGAHALGVNLAESRAE